MQLGAEFAAVLHRAQQRDEEAFALIWRSCNPILLRYLALRVPAAADLASEVWITVVRSLADFDGSETEFRAWLLELARNRARSWKRGSSRHPEVEMGEAEQNGWLETVADTEAVVIDSLSAQEAVVLVARLLPPLQAEAVVLRVVAELDVAETAQVMGKAVGTVRVLTHRGLKNLARHLHGRSTAEVHLRADW